jgi:hypothetical protein
VSSVRKLFLATALITTGLAVAVLLGHPIKNQQSTAAVVHASPPKLEVPLSPLAATPAPGATSAIRLTPDTEYTNVAAIPDPPALLSPLSSYSLAPSSGPDFRFAPSSASAVTASTQRVDTNSTIAKLRDEAPRAIGNESRSPVTIRRAPPVDAQIASASAATDGSPLDAYHVAPNWPAASPSPAPPTPNNSSFAATPTPATATAFAMSGAPRPDSHEQAPSPQLAEEADDARTHIVADGDSLEKLASLYLNDPQRGKEIYELNRGILSDPNLLPIGAELKIPDRTSPVAWARQSRLPGYQGDAAVREAATGDLIPARSMSSASYSGPPPHAQLTRPIEAD